MTSGVKRGLKPIPEGRENIAVEFLARIAFIRAFETQALDMSQTNPPRIAGSLHLCAGQEAVAVGAIAGLGGEDQVLATYRGHGWAIASGLDPYALMAELCHRGDGINGGRGGSAYFMAPGTRFVGENSIVGAGTTIACGVAIANLAARNDRVTVVTIGDGAMNQGSVHEAMSFAAVRKLPVIFIVENNGWSELTATPDMFRIDRLAQRASGYGISSATVDGSDPFSVADSVAMAAERARTGNGPALLEFKVPRLWGHYNRDIEHYRPKADRLAAQERDPLALLSARLIDSGVLTAGDAAGIVDDQNAAAAALAERALAADPPEAATARSHVIAAPSPRGAAPAVVATRDMTYIEAVNAALRAELESRPETVVFGEDVGKAGGIFGATRYLQRDFGADRVFDTPIAENAILGSAVGAALGGLRPIVEIMWADFLFVAFDQLVNQAANVRYVTGGRQTVPLVVRTQQGMTPGSCSQHSQSIEALLAHIPGLKVALAATAQDAYDLLRAAAADPDPCVVIEARSQYQVKETVSLTGTAQPAGIARLRRNGDDCAIITWGSMVKEADRAAGLLDERGIDAAVLDLRWLNPLDEHAIADTVRQANGKVLIVHEAVKTGGFAGELAMRLTEMELDIPLVVKRLCTPDVRIPAAPNLQDHLRPGAEDIAQAVESLLGTRVAVA